MLSKPQKQNRSMNPEAGSLKKLTKLITTSQFDQEEKGKEPNK